MKKRSEWMEGLLLAEAMGREEVMDLLTKHEFKDSSIQYQNGVIDYISHANRLEKMNGVPMEK